jgi:hypothetical protein
MSSPVLRRKHHSATTETRPQEKQPIESRSTTQPLGNSSRCRSDSWRKLRPAACRSPALLPRAGPTPWPAPCRVRARGEPKWRHRETHPRLDLPVESRHHRRRIPRGPVCGLTSHVAQALVNAGDPLSEPRHHAVPEPGAQMRASSLAGSCQYQRPRDSTQASNGAEEAE